MQTAHGEDILTEGVPVTEPPIDEPLIRTIEVAPGAGQIDDQGDGQEPDRQEVDNISGAVVLTQQPTNMETQMDISQVSNM